VKKLPCLVYLYTNEIKLKGPNTTIDMCLKRDLSYAIQLYVPGEYSYSVEQKQMNTESKAQDLLLSRSIKRHKLKEYVLNKISFFGEIPLMTEEGTFIVNGCERIVISQIIRSPVFILEKEFGTKRKTVYTATIISNKVTKFVFRKKKKKKNQL
jgi:DNA-directed RNA polymerase beta subunit